MHEVMLIDGDNNTCSGNGGPYRSSLHGFPTETEYKGSIRDMLLFDVPKDIIIRSLRIVPSHSDPFYINWIDMPEVTDHNCTLRFTMRNAHPHSI